MSWPISRPCRNCHPSPRSEKISQLARDPKSDMKEWIKVIEVEPMTCAMILRHANSSAMGMQVEITAGDRAIVMLGKNTVSGLVASEVVRKSFTAVEDMGFKLEEFWLHNLAVGYSAHLLSLAVATDGEAQGLSSHLLECEPAPFDRLRANGYAPL